MPSYRFKRVYHPKLGKYVYQHKGSGLFVDNIFKPLSKMMGKASQMVLKPLAKKALRSGIGHAREKLGKKSVEKSGDLIMKKLQGKVPRRTETKEEDFNTILNQLISGSGIKKAKK